MVKYLHTYGAAHLVLSAVFGWTAYHLAVASPALLGCAVSMTALALFLRSSFNQTAN